MHNHADATRIHQSQLTCAACQIGEMPHAAHQRSKDTVKIATLSAPTFSVPYIYQELIVTNIS